MAPKKKDAKLTRAGVSGYNKPKRTPKHPKKSHVVVKTAHAAVIAVKRNKYVDGKKTNNIIRINSSRQT